LTYRGTIRNLENITKLGMPPAVRLLDPVFVAMTGGDWDKFASHTVWTYFPFGRLAKGLTRTIENPTMIAENMFGIPLHDVPTRLKGTNESPIVSAFGAEWIAILPYGGGFLRAGDNGNLKRDLDVLEARFESVDEAARKLLGGEGIDTYK
jgi:hypothetical protein